VIEDKGKIADMRVAGKKLVSVRVTTGLWAAVKMAALVRKTTVEGLVEQALHLLMQTSDRAECAGKGPGGPGVGRACDGDLDDTY